MLNPVRWYRNKRADRRALKNMTPAQRAIARAYRVPPRMLGRPGTYANVEATRREAFDYHCGGRHYLCPAPTTGGHRCLTPLPCHEHNVDNYLVGSLLYGNAYLQMPDDRRPTAHFTLHTDGSFTDNRTGERTEPGQ